jgi:hypothetical protein
MERTLIVLSKMGANLEGLLKCGEIKSAPDGERYLLIIENTA